MAIRDATLVIHTNSVNELLDSWWINPGEWLSICLHRLKQLYQLTANKWKANQKAIIDSNTLRVLWHMSFSHWQFVSGIQTKYRRCLFHVCMICIQWWYVINLWEKENRNSTLKTYCSFVFSNRQRHLKQRTVLCAHVPTSWWGVEKHWICKAWGIKFKTFFTQKRYRRTSSNFFPAKHTKI